MSTPYSPRRQSPTMLRAAPYQRIRDSVDPSNADPSSALLLQNCYPAPSGGGPPIVGRPGFALAGAQLASGGRVQGIYQFTQLDGTEHTVAIVGGKFYTYDWGGDSWTETLTAAQLSAASVTLSSTERCYFATFADELVVNDGANRPWSWDGTSGGGITSLTNGPATAFGRPAVYYAKLFFIKGSERSTMVWSEENAVNTGYEAGGYNNAWTLGQTEQEPLYALHGTNEALYYWRARSTGAVYGAVSPTFSTTGTHEAVSQTVGTTAPGSVVQYERAIFFVDSSGRPQRLDPGGGMAPVWKDCYETVRRLPVAQLGDALGLAHTPTEIALLAVTPLGETEPSQMLGFNPRTGEFVTVWRGFTFSAAAMVKDADGDPTMMYGTTDGYVYYQGSPEGALWDDADGPINHVVEGTVLAYDESLEKRFLRADITLRTEADMTNVSFDLTTPNGRSLALAFSVEGNYAVWGEFLWGTTALGGVPVDSHVALGLNSFGRWGRPRLIHEADGEKFGFVDWGILALPAGNSPGVM